MRLRVDRGLPEIVMLDGISSGSASSSRVAAIKGSSARPDQRRMTLAPDCVSVESEEHDGRVGTTEKRAASATDRQRYSGVP